MGGEVSTHQHVQIVEPPGARVLCDILRRGADAYDRRPIPPVIRRHAPRVAHALAPRPHAVAPPLAQVEVDVLCALDAGDGVAHGGVPRLRVALWAPARLRQRARVAWRVAVVVLPEVDVPRGEELRVLHLVALRARVARARLGAGAAVEAEFQAQGVDLLRHGADAVGPFGGVGDEEARRVARLGRPAVVDVDVAVADVFEAERDEEVGRVERPFFGGGVALACVLVGSQGRSRKGV